jgi:hypothetical protein
MAEFEPKIVAFLCNWCSYRGADLAGTSRIKYPTNVRVIRVMCSSSIDPVYVLKALLDGADGLKKALNYVPAGPFPLLFAENRRIKTYVCRQSLC